MTDAPVYMMASFVVDPEYQAISEHRRASATMHFLTLVHGQAPFA